MQLVPRLLLFKGYKLGGGDFSFFHQLAKTDDVQADPGITGVEERAKSYANNVAAKVREAAESAEARKQHFDYLWDTTEPVLAEAEQERELGPALRSLKCATIATAWTAVECLAGDAWEAALNSHPNRFCQRTANHLPQDRSESDGLTRKSISVGLLARHAFDLSATMGTVLAGKFDFTGVSGIETAYLK